MCKHKENGDDVPLGDPYSHPRNASDIDPADTSSPACDLTKEELQEPTNKYKDIINHLNDLIALQKETIQQKDDTIKQQKHIISMLESIISRQDDDIKQLKTEHNRQTETISISTKKISELESCVESLSYANPIKAEYQPTKDNLNHIYSQLATYIDHRKDQLPHIHNTIRQLLASRQLAVVRSRNNPKETDIVVTAQHLSDFIRALFDMMNDEKLQEFATKKKGATPRMANWLVKIIKQRKGEHNEPTEIGFDTLREIIRRAAKRHIEKHEISATF
ncbi:MAG: hypothetical protein IJ604_07130 [Prevotella sp.]|nr:hypothetical protein [Prevotella sp.]